MYAILIEEKRWKLHEQKACHRLLAALAAGAAVSQAEVRLIAHSAQEGHERRFRHPRHAAEIKKGENVCMFAEGVRTWDGVTCPIAETTGQMVKRADGIPVRPCAARTPRAGIRRGAGVLRVVHPEGIQHSEVC